MDTTKTHVMPVVMGQIWRRKGDGQYQFFVRHITQKNIVRLRFCNGLMGGDRRVPLDELLSEWECVYGVELKEYTQHGKMQIQVFSGGSVIGNLKLTDDERNSFRPKDSGAV